MKAKLGGLDSEKKLQELEFGVEGQESRLDKILKEIEDLQKLAGEFDGFTSTAEEESFIELLISELSGAKGKHKEGKDNCGKLKKLIFQTRGLINRKRQGKELSEKDIDEIVNEIVKVDEKVVNNEKLVSELEKLVEQKKKRFLEMDIMKKLRRREKELEEMTKLIDDIGGSVKEVEKEIGDDLEKCKANPEENDVIIKNLKSFTAEFEGLNKEIEQCREKKTKIEEDL
jgi:chromosome segregation ATPase